MIKKFALLVASCSLLLFSGCSTERSPLVHLGEVLGRIEAAGLKDKDVKVDVPGTFHYESRVHDFNKNASDSVTVTPVTELRVTHEAGGSAPNVSAARTNMFYNDTVAIHARTNTAPATIRQPAKKK